MPDRLDLADLRKTCDLRAHVIAAQGFGRIDRRHIQFGKLVRLLARRTSLEQQRFVLGDVIANFVDHASTSWRSPAGCAIACPTSSMSALRDISVAHSSMQSASSG